MSQGLDFHLTQATERDPSLFITMCRNFLVSTENFRDGR
jgi:hypothetical protein